MKLDGIMLNEHGGSTDDGVRSDISSENCRVIRHFTRSLEISRRFRTSEYAEMSRLFFPRPKTRFLFCRCFCYGVKTETVEFFGFDEKVRFL